VRRALFTPEDLHAAAFEAAKRVCAGEISRAQAADDVWDRAIGGGLVRLHGEDMIQAWISGCFSMIDQEIGPATSPLYEKFTTVLDEDEPDRQF
jgi:hypothetical protein